MNNSQARAVTYDVVVEAPRKGFRFFESLPNDPFPSFEPALYAGQELSKFEDESSSEDESSDDEEGISNSLNSLS